MNKKYVYVAVITFGLIVIVIPFFIDWAIIGSDIPSNILNSEWVAFLGGYIGAILGAIFSLVGIVWTIKFTREQNKLDRELQIRPYFDIRFLEKKEFCSTKSWLGYVMVEIWDNDETDAKHKNYPVGCGLLCLKNVGNGPATNINFQVSVEDIKCKYQAYFSNQNSRVTTNSVLASETAELSIDILNSRLAPKEDDFVRGENSSFATCENRKYVIPDDFTIRLIMEYSDLMSNRFLQELSFDVNYYMVHKNGEDGKYHCDINLSKIANPNIDKK